MPTLKTRQTDWTGGEWDRTLGARVDIDKYARAADTLENFMILQSGGVRRRPGTRHQGIARARARLIPFQFSEGEAVAIEASDHLFRFYTSHGRLESAPGVPVEVPHPYFIDELDEVNWTPSADVLLFVHPAHPPARLERLTSDGLLWRYRAIIFDPPPSREFGERPTTVNATLTPSATTGSITLTASAGIFMASDVQRKVQVLVGANVGAQATITAFTSSTQVTAAVTEPWTTLAATPANAWRITDSPVTTVTPSVKDPVGAVGTLTLGAPGWRPTDVGKFVSAHGGTFRIDSITSDVVAQMTVMSEATAITAVPAGAWTLEEPAFSPASGYPSVVAFAEDRLWFFATPAQPQGAWASKSSDYFNFAEGVLDDDAISFTLNSDQVNPIRWALPYNRGLMLSTSGEEWVVDAGEGNTLTPSSIAQAVKPATTYGTSRFVRPVKIGTVVLFGTRSRRKLRELAPDPNAIATSVFVAPDMTLLVEHLTRPVRLDNIKQDRRLVALAWQREPQSTVWVVRADGTLASFAYQRDQNVAGWCRHILTPFHFLDADGRQIPAGNEGRVESVIVLPHADDDRDQVWLVVRRVIEGNPDVWHIETLEDQGVVFDDGYTLDDTRSYDGQKYLTTLDASALVGTGVTFTASGPTFAAELVGQEIRQLPPGGRALITAYTSPTVVTGTVVAAFRPPLPLEAGRWGIAANLIGGLEHLEGRTVSIVGDGAVYPDQVVAGGTVALAGGPRATKIEAGLNYLSRLRTLKPEVAGFGTVQGRQKRTARLVLRLYKSMGFRLNDAVVPFRQGQDALGTGPAVFTGDLDLANLGWSTDGMNVIEQPLPLPLTLLGIFPLLSVDD